MRKTKRMLAVALAATMVFGSSLTAFADEPVTSGGTNGSGTSEGHVDQELINVVLPTVASGSTPFAYTMDPERLIQETDAAKYAEGTTFPDAEGDTGVYFLTAANTYSNTSNTLQAINKSSCNITLTVKVKTTQNTAKDIALATSSTVATTGTPNLYLGLKVGNDTTVVKADEQTVTKTIAGSPANFEIAVADDEYVYQEKASATIWKAMNLSMEGAVSNLAVESDTTAPTVNVTWSYAKAADDATTATDAVSYTTTPASAAPSLTGQNEITITEEDNGGRALTIGMSLGTGDEAATAITKIDCNGGTITTDKYSLSSSGVVLTSDFVDAMLASSNTADRVFTVYLNDTATTTLTFTIKR